MAASAAAAAVVASFATAADGSDVAAFDLVQRLAGDAQSCVCFGSALRKLHQRQTTFPHNTHTDTQRDKNRHADTCTLTFTCGTQHWDLEVLADLEAATHTHTSKRSKRARKVS